MKIAFVAALSKNRISGPSNSVTNLAKNCCAEVFTNLKYDCQFKIYGISVKNKKELFKNINKYDVVVITGIFDKNNLDVFEFCIKNKINYIISSRGNLTRVSFKRSGLKKKIFMLLYGYKFIKNSMAIHYLSEEERDNSITTENKKIIISSNGVLNANKNENKENEIRENNIIFIGRIDIFHKGLDRLIKQVRRNQKYLRDKIVKIRIFGPSNRNDKNELKKKVSKYNIQDIVKIENAVNNLERDSLLLTNKYFIHTSRLEGQPQAVLEAISRGCIPIVTNECNLSKSVSEYNLGFIVDCERDKNIFTFLEKDKHIDYQKNCYDYSNKFLGWEFISKEFLNDIKL